MENKEGTGFRQAINCLPIKLQTDFDKLKTEEKAICQEIRLRCGQPICLQINGKEKIFGKDVISNKDLSEIINRATQYSVHSFAESLKNGFITIEGGHRIGICGTAVIQNGALSSFQNITSLNIRIARQIKKAASDAIINSIYDGEFLTSSLIISPPGWGKTTLLRDTMRQISDKGVRVSVADERCELCGVYHGIPQFDIGEHTDVIDSCPKAIAALILLKTMSPQLLIMDEITSEKDAEAIFYSAHCGVAVLATAHALDFDDFRQRVLYKKVLDMRIFEQIIEIKHDWQYDIIKLKGSEPCA